MPSGSFSESLATFKVAVSSDRTLKDLTKRNTCHQLLCNCRREWSFNFEKMEVNARSSHRTNETKSVDYSASANERSIPSEKDVGASVFVNHAEIAWHETRRKWVGDQSQQQQRTAKDPIISWLTTYEELLSTNQPFSEPIPLPEMVDFLVDIWHDQGLFD